MTLEQAQTFPPVKRPAGQRSHYLPVESAGVKPPAGLYRIPRGGTDVGLAAGGEWRYDALISSAARHYGLPPSLLKAVAKAESGFSPGAVSDQGAMGLMQLMPGTARALGVSDPFDPAQNVFGGARYLSQQMERFGSVDLALAAYNAGPGAVRQYGGIPPFSETENFVDRVLGYERDFERKLAQP